MISLRDAIEQYTRSEKSIKEIICQKQLSGWNLKELTNKIKMLIYSIGYRNHICIVNLKKNFPRNSFLFYRLFLFITIKLLLVHHQN